MARKALWQYALVLTKENFEQCLAKELEILAGHYQVLETERKH